MLWQEGKRRASESCSLILLCFKSFTVTTACWFRNLDLFYATLVIELKAKARSLLTAFVEFVTRSFRKINSWVAMWEQWLARKVLPTWRTFAATPIENRPQTRISNNSQFVSFLLLLLCLRPDCVCAFDYFSFKFRFYLAIPFQPVRFVHSSGSR